MLEILAPSQMLHQVAQEGIALDAEAVSRLSSYLTEHVTRFGNYTLNLNRAKPPPGDN